MDSSKGAANSRANGRPSSSQFQVNTQGRKPLFATSKDDSNKDEKPDLARYRPPGANEGPARRTNSQSLSRRDSTASTASPGATRIPKQNLTLTESYKLARQEEEPDDESQVMDASPSPAPRSWRARRDGEDDKLREKGLGEDHLDSKSRSRSVKEETKSEEPEKKSNIAKTGSRTTETGRELAKVTGNESSWRERPDWRTRPKTGSEWFKELGSGEKGDGAGIPDLVPGIEDLPLPSVEGGDQGAPSLRRSTTAPKGSKSPEKSFAWEIDDDFTAGDLQVSTSPRIKTDNRPFANRLKFDENSEVDINSKTRVNNPGSQNTRLDEIRSREVKSGSNIPIERPQSRSRNSKLDEIKAREDEVEQQIPIADRHLGPSSNKKLDDIKKREEEGLTPRQLSQAKLEEIREQNAASRSKSPEESRPSPRSDHSQEHKRTPGDKPMWRPAGERKPVTPVTVYKTREERIAHARASSKSSVDLGKKESESPRPSHKRADSRDLLRQLARAASTSPAPETQPRKSALSNRNSSSSTSDRRSPRRAQTTLNVTGRKKNGKESGISRPTVGFASLRRVKSSESSSGSKRSSVHSEDPTDRIDAEAKLFAPRDDYSERGSVRATSPVSDSRRESEGEVDVTPRAPKFDPTTLPTPRVTGAYVDTPVTAKSQRFESNVQSNNDLIASIRSKRALRRRDTDTNSEPGEDEKPSSASSAEPSEKDKIRRPRSSSLPRRRGPLKNSALPATVKADLMELRRSYNIEESTIDANFDDILLNAASPQLKASLDDLPDHPIEEDSFDQTLKEYSELPARRPSPMKYEVKVEDHEEDEGDLEAYNRMSKSLQTGLMGIRTAKQGIERLEDNLTHPVDSKPKIKRDTTTPPPVLPNKQLDEVISTTTPKTPTLGSVAYILLPVPRLWKSQPKFRFTWLGMILFMLGLWYTLESGMCKMYCQPVTCTTTPCVWSYDDPTFGNALPVKLDQWATGGLGRSLVSTATEQAEDWVADILDMAHGREITDVDISALSFEGKRAHRRRLRKKGLLKCVDDAKPEVRARWDAWHHERIEQQKARDLREMGYHSVREEDESIGGDQRIW